MSSGLFRKESRERISSPDDLSDYIRVISPGVWALIAAVTLLIAASLIWSFTAKIPMIITTNGIGSDGEIYCFVPADEGVDLADGMRVMLDDGVEGYIDSIEDMPFSKTEVSEIIGSDYLTSQLSVAEWSSFVHIVTQADVVFNEIYSVQIVSAEIRPIDFLLKKGE